ncbi:aldo/keto reductase [Bacteroides sp. GD17]|jgi:predicted aldo/keto reductase-like oxidoreductase|uniref:aldo/keto reductase n=1 Tax=Bacteroides sp. GD17 TaxID=3139826 RepID=UPI00313B1EB4
MKKEPQNKINRRDFFKLAGAGTVASAAALYGCSNKKENSDSASAALGEVPTDKMVYRTNPTTGDRVSLLGYGCMRWPTRKRSDGEGDEIDQEAVNELVDYAIAHGVNYFDTSPAYVQGLSERATGIALKRHPREKFFVATKLSNFSPSTQSREGSLAMYRNSFKELQVDYIDYMLLHSIGSGGMDALHARYLDNGMLDFLLKEREAGRIRNLGFSYHGDVEVFDYLLSKHDEYKWDFVQIQLNYVDWKHAKEMNDRNTDAEYLYNELVKRGIPAVIMEPLLGGRLSRLNDHLVGRLKQHRPQNSVASWAFRYAGSFPDVLTVLSGMTYMEHLQDNLRTYSPLEPCTEEELALLEDTAQRMLQYPTVPCNDCKYCMPCPYGLDIPAILLHYNRCVNEGNVPKSSQDENYREARRAFLIGYDRSVPKLRQASHCTGCNQCNPHCPQNIDIPKKLQEIDRFVEDLKQEKL